MKVYQYKNPFWLYERPNLWKRIKAEIPKIVIMGFIGGGLVIAVALAEGVIKL